MNHFFLEFNNVSRFFKTHKALKELNFTINKGDKYALIGPNGAGKSTLFRLIVGLICPSNGKIIYSENLNHISWVSEGAPLNSDLTIKEHLKLIADLLALDKAEYKIRKERIIEQLNLNSYLNVLAINLSYGTKRRAALAVALMANPKFLILDEPSSGLDPEEAIRLRDVIKNLVSDVTLIVSSHNLEELPLITDKVMVLNNGNLIYNNSWVEVKKINQKIEDAYLHILNKLSVL